MKFLNTAIATLAGTFIAVAAVLLAGCGPAAPPAAHAQSAAMPPARPPEAFDAHKGGFYHDGRFATLDEVIDHYDRFLKLRLTDAQKKELIEYLKSI